MRKLKKPQLIFLALAFAANLLVLVFLLSKGDGDKDEKDKKGKLENVALIDQKEVKGQSKQNTSLNSNDPIVLRFEVEREELVKMLPRKQDLQKLEAHQVHQIPDDLLKAGRKLGNLKELSLRYPKNIKLQEKAKSFYQQCAKDEQFPTSIRSLCLFNRSQLAKNSGEDFDLESYPPEIKALAMELINFN